jgi:hypothetical protein
VRTISPYAEYRIDARLVQRAQILGAGRWHVPDEGDPDAARSVAERAARAGCSPRELLWQEAAECDVSSRPGGALYWGYRTDWDPPVENHYIALAWAERHNARHPDSPVVTFWTTDGAARLNPANRLNDAQRTALGIGSYYLLRVWENMCVRYSDESSGEVLVFGSYFHPDVILGRTELPALRRNPRVGADRIRWVYPPPERLSDGRRLTDDLRDILNAPGNRACVQFDRPDRPGHLDPVRAARYPYRVLEEIVAGLREQVATADRTWDPLPMDAECPAGIPWYPPEVKRVPAASTQRRAQAALR